MRRILIVSAIGVLLSTGCRADYLKAVRPAEGFVCMQVNFAKPDDSLDPSKEVSAHEFPVITSKIVGIAGSTLLARPSEVRNGFQQIVYPTGKIGWVQASSLKPWKSATNPNSRCIPSVLSNGLLGFDIAG